MDHDAYDPTTDSAFEPSEHDSDTFSAQDDIAVGARNKRQPKKKATVPKKKARRTRQSATRDIDAPASLIAPRALDKRQTLRLVPSNDTPNVNRWLDALPTLSVKEKVAHGPLAAMKTQLTPLGDLPDIAGRRFKYEVKLVELDINHNPAEGEKRGISKRTLTEEKTFIDRYNKKTKTWRVSVWNDALPKDQQKKLQIFPEVQKSPTSAQQQWNGRVTQAKKTPKHTVPPPPADPYISICIGGPLDISACPNESAAFRVAAEACRLLDKYPFEIDIDDFPEEIKFNGSHRSSGMRTLVEL
jgi:hypothetical protein